VARVGKVRISIGQSWTYLLIGLLIVLLADGDLTSTSIRTGVRTALLWWACLLVAVVIHEVSHMLASLALRVDVHDVVLDVWAGHCGHGSRTS